MRYPKRPTSLKVVLSRQFRQEATAAEKTVWSLVRNRRLLGLKFRRQHVIDGFIADFYCPSLRLVLEIDGPVHDGPARKHVDDARTHLFTAKGLRVARLRNEEVGETAIIAAVRRATEQQNTPLHEMERGRGEAWRPGLRPIRTPLHEMERDRGEAKGQG